MNHEELSAMLTERMHRIREIINTPRTHRQLYKDKAKFLQICSSLDVIDDTQLAISHYRLNAQSINQFGLYLYIYGLLQAFHVQQDAVISLAKALNLRIDLTTRLREIRETRNDCIGHPTNRRLKKDNECYVFINRPFLTWRGFTISFYSRDEGMSYKQIDLYQMIQDQEVEICAILDKIIAELEERDKAHKVKYASKPLSQILSHDFDYATQKIYEGIFKCDVSRVAQYWLSKIATRLETVNKEYLKREGGISDHLQHDFDLCQYAVKQLDAWFASRQNQRVSNSKLFQAEVLYEFLRNKVNEIIEILAELDTEYSQ